MKPIEFKPPAGLVPEGAEADSIFEEVATFRVKPNGNICLVAVGEHQLGGYKDDTRDYGEKAGNRYAEKMAES